MIEAPQYDVQHTLKCDRRFPKLASPSSAVSFQYRRLPTEVSVNFILPTPGQLTVSRRTRLGPPVESILCIELLDILRHASAVNRVRITSLKLAGIVRQGERQRQSPNPSFSTATHHGDCNSNLAAWAAEWPALSAFDSF
jgi:hypothetical protein